MNPFSLVAIGVVVVVVGTVALRRAIRAGRQGPSTKGLCYYCGERPPVKGDSICQRCAEEQAL